jgi:hypothetical protein
MFKEVPVNITFLTVEQKANGRIKNTEALHCGLPATHVGSEQYNTVPFPDEVLDLLLIVEDNRHRPGALDAYRCPVN